MKLWKNAVLLSLPVCVISLVLLFVLHSCAPSSLGYDISLGVFSSAIVVAMFNLVNYFSEKRKTIKIILLRVNNYTQWLHRFSSELALHLQQIDEKPDVKTINSILTNKNLFDFARRLSEEYFNVVLFGDGFYPIMQKSSGKNVLISQLLADLVSIQGVISKYKVFYERRANPKYYCFTQNEIVALFSDLWLLSFCNIKNNKVLPLTKLLSDLLKIFSKSGMLRVT